MSLIFCPECHAKISSSASVCPHCGFTAQGEETGIVLISSLPPAKVTPRVTVLDATVFDNGMNLIPAQTNESLVKFPSDADAMAKFAPAIYDIIQKLAGRGEMKYVADCILQFFRCDVPQSVGVPFHKSSVCACMWNRCGRGA